MPRLRRSDLNRSIASCRPRSHASFLGFGNGLFSCHPSDFALLLEHLYDPFDCGDSGRDERPLNLRGSETVDFDHRVV